MSNTDNLKTLMSIDKSKLVMMPLSQIELNDGQLDGLPKNPRSIKKKKFEKLKKNIETYPEMLAFRMMLVYPLDNGNYIIIGGNMRYQALKQLGQTEAPVFIIPKETPVERLQAYTIIDNNGFGEWDWDLLANEWPEDMLDEWGLDIPMEDEEEEKSDAYTRKVDGPTYTPSGNVPTFAEMCDTTKRDELIEDINRADVPDDVREFLIDAAYRHTVFNYEKIADYYAQAPAEVQDLMERSALVIIDFNKAIEYGFVKLTSQLAEAYQRERGIDEDAITVEEISEDYDEE